MKTDTMYPDWIAIASLDLSQITSINMRWKECPGKFSLNQKNICLNDPFVLYISFMWFLFCFFSINIHTDENGYKSPKQGRNLICIQKIVQKRMQKIGRKSKGYGQCNAPYFIRGCSFINPHAGDEGQHSDDKKI